MIKIFLISIFLVNVVYAINSSFFLPIDSYKSNLKVATKFSFNNDYYFYKSSPFIASIPSLCGVLNFNNEVVFKLRYSYFLVDTKDFINSENIEKIRKKSNKLINDRYAIGGGDIISSVDISLKKIKLNNSELLIETKWPDAEYEAGFGTDMTDVCFRFINRYFYDKYNTTLNFGLKVISNPMINNTQSDYYTFGATYNNRYFTISINEDIGRYNLQHSLFDFRLKTVINRFEFVVGSSYKKSFVNSSFSVGYFIL